MEGGIIKIVKNKHFFRRLTSGVSVEVVTLPPNLKLRLWKLNQTSEWTFSWPHENGQNYLNCFNYLSKKWRVGIFSCKCLHMSGN